MYNIPKRKPFTKYGIHFCYLFWYWLNSDYLFIAAFLLKVLLYTTILGWSTRYWKYKGVTVFTFLKKEINQYFFRKIFEETFLEWIEWQQKIFCWSFLIQCEKVLECKKIKGKKYIYKKCRLFFFLQIFKNKFMFIFPVYILVLHIAVLFQFIENCLL